MATKADMSSGENLSGGGTVCLPPAPDVAPAVGGGRRPGPPHAWHRQGIQRVIMTMRERLYDPPSLHAMSESASISPFHFERVFRDLTGISPRKFIGALRIGEANRLLVSTPLKVTDICYEVGYNSPGTFTSRFAQLVGAPPRTLRRLARNSGVTLPPSPTSVLCRSQAPTPERAVTGRVNAPEGFSGMIFVGLFPDPIPQGVPAGCDLVTGGTIFHIAPVDDGRYHIFAAAFPWYESPLRMWENAARYVGGGACPVVVRNGEANLRSPITLRPSEVTDPPILISLPYLLTRFSPAGEQTAC